MILSRIAYRSVTAMPEFSNIIVPKNDTPHTTRFDDAKYVSLTMEFRCNLRCTHCMIEGTMDRLRPTSDEEFKKILRTQEATHQWEGIILTGSEITLRRDLPKLATQARTAGFPNVRIQTHGMHLARPGYLDRLLQSGVNEFFISVAGHNATLHDHITKVDGAFDKMITGIKMIENSDIDARVITNTVITSESYYALSDIVHLLAQFQKVVRHEFWNFFPMDGRDHKTLLVKLEHLMPHVIAAIKSSIKAGKKCEIKNIPECLLAEFAQHLVNDQPMLLIDNDFWIEFDRNSFHNCPHQDICQSKQCLGLTSAYISRFGNEKNLLTPIKNSARNTSI